MVVVAAELGTGLVTMCDRAPGPPGLAVVVAALIAANKWAQDVISDVVTTQAKHSLKSTTSYAYPPQYML